MTLAGLALASLRNRRFGVALTVLVITMSVTLLLAVERIREQAQSGFHGTISGTDLVVGARSGPVSLLLYTVFHIGEPTSNVSWQSYRELSALPQVRWAIPLSLGDSYRGHRVVGTSTAYFEHYRHGDAQPLAFAQGGPFADLYDAVLGAEVAASLDHALDDEIVLAHGIGRSNIARHDDAPFRVAGILRRTGTPLDRSVLVSLQAVEAIHRDWQSGMRLPGSGGSAEDARALELTPDSITAFLLGLDSPVSSFQVQRRINGYRAEPLLAILPGVALQQLWRVVGVAEQALRLIAALVVLLGLVSMIALLVSSLQERRREMAVLRAVGARPRDIAALLLAEATLLTTVAAACALALVTLASWALRPWLLERFGLALQRIAPSPVEWLWLACVIVAGALAGTIPALLAYRRTLADGLHAGN